MIQTRIVIRPTRNVRDIYRRRKYKVVARFPGGREIDLGHAETRQRAFKQARTAVREIGALVTDENSGLPAWKRGTLDDVIVY